MKKIISLALVFAMVLTMSVTAFAQEITGESGSTVITGESGSTVITYNADESYVVTIPDSMSVGTDATVSVKDVVLASGKELTVSVSSTQYSDGWKLKNGDNTIGYTLKIDNTDVDNNGTVLTVKSGETATKTLQTALTGTAKYSGNYTDKLTFTVATADVPVDNSKIFFDADSLKNAGKVGDEIKEVLTAALANAPKTGEVTLTMQMSAEYTTPDFYSINSALYSSDIESLNLTINGLTNITSDLTKGGNLSFLNLNRICLPDVTTLGQNTLYGCTNLTHVELTAEGTITLGSSAFHDYYSKDINLVLNTDKQDEVTGGNTWQGYTFKSITFVDTTT